MQIGPLRRQVLNSIASFEEPLEAKASTDRLMEYYTGKDAFFVLLNPQTEVDAGTCARIETALDALREGNPLQYLLHEAWFYGNPFYVNAHTLIPRPETEELVQWALQDFPSGFAGKGIDLCCGTACIAVTMALMRPQSRWQCVDAFPETLAVAERNIRHYGVPVETCLQDLLAPAFASFGASDYDLLLCNPPYVMESERGDMARKVKDFEPSAALFVPDDQPLLFYKSAVDWAKRHLRKGGAVYFEINERLGERMLQLMQQESLTRLTLKKDLRNKDRMLRIIL